MLYISNGKVYLRVSNRYKEVSIIKKGNNDYTVKANREMQPLEESQLKDLTEISLEKAYDTLNKKENPKGL